MKPSAREFLQLYCKIHRWKNDGGCAFYHNTWRIPNAALRKPNLYVTQAGTYESDISLFLCWQRKRTRCDIENWGHFLPASWPTTSSHYVGGTILYLLQNVCQKTGMSHAKKFCRCSTLPLLLPATGPRFLSPQYFLYCVLSFGRSVMKFIFILCCFTFVWRIYIFFLSE